jgi:ubiquinol-cytochrome c reductase cytochrome b subunit
MSALDALREASAAAGLVLLLLLAFSGWGLMGGYVPSDAEAFASVLFSTRGTSLGAFLRSVHVYAASGVVVVGAVYLLAAYLSGSYRVGPPSWWLPLSLYLVVLGFCFTGFLLPMDQGAYWGTVVRLGIVETVPVAGPPLADLLRGGASFNASTLPRFHALHVSVLPIAALVLLLPLLPAARARLRGSGPAPLVAVAALVLAAIYLLATIWPAALEPRADPNDTEYVPRPEWYFLWLFQLGKYLEAVPWVRSLILPAAGLGFLYALPLLRLPSPPTRAAVAAGWCLAWSVLTGLARWEDRALPPKPTHAQAQEARAAVNYREQCLDCHGEAGRGDGPQARAFGLDARDFTRVGFWKEASEERILESIRNGRGADMPAFGKRLDAEQIEALLVYLRNRFQPKGEP